MLLIQRTVQTAASVAKGREKMQPNPHDVVQKHFNRNAVVVCFAGIMRNLFFLNPEAKSCAGFGLCAVCGAACAVVSL